MTVEKRRLIEDRDKKKNWRKFGPYLTERQWGTVREDYSPHGTAWEYVSHDAARSKAYRWGEEGIGGICDNRQLLCFALGFWNKKDPLDNGCLPRGYSRFARASSRICFPPSSRVKRKLI